MQQQGTNAHGAGQDVGSPCLICGSTSFLELLAIAGVPVHCNTLWPTRESAQQAIKGDIDLVFCTQCGHIFNRAFKPSLVQYGEEYENSLYFSPRFRRYSEKLVSRLTAEFGLDGKEIVEVGSGSGDFLRALCRDGRNRGIGFDPAYSAPGPVPNYLTFCADLYSAKYSHLKADFVCSRHVLEHVADPLDVLRAIKAALTRETRSYGYFEVPNAEFLFEDGSIWDIIYTHVSYFSRTSFVNLLEKAGFEVLCAAPYFEGQFLGIDFCTPNGHARENLPVPSPSAMLPSITRFPKLYKDTIAFWAERICSLAETGRKVVLWGGGSKCVSFLQAMGKSCSIRYVVDINPRKHYQFVPGSGAEIVPPEFLMQFRPDVVVVMNPIYHDEIQAMLADLGLGSAQVESLRAMAEVLV